jgi:hypothetical protein
MSGAQESTKKRVPRETNEKIVLKAYSGAKTEEESKIVLKKFGLEESQARKIRKGLEKGRKLVRIKGNPNKWIPRDEVVFDRSDLEDSESDEPEEIPEYAPTLLAEKVLKDIDATIEEIDRDYFVWKKPRKIRRIFMKMIFPLCDSLIHLNDTLGYSITLPASYFKDFKEEEVLRWKTLLVGRGSRGYVGVRLPSTIVSVTDGDSTSSPPRKKPDWPENNNVASIVFPGLLEWKGYLFKIRDDVEIELRKRKG